MSACPICDQPIPADARFCGSCGHQMAETTQRSELVGKTIANRYRVLRVIAEGGMGVVYEAEQAMGEGVRKVAIKTLLPELSRDPIVVSRFHRECSVVASLEHPNTVRVYDFGSTEDGILYIAMEFVRGYPLGDIIAQGPVPLNRAMSILEQIASALDEAHSQGIVHRDLKPDNIVLCDRAGLHDFVKVLDFGIAKRSSAGGRHDTKLTQQGMVLGTPPYMSPEQFSGEALDRTSDVYSLGIIVYEMLNGRLPFEGDTPWQWAHQHMTQAPAAFSVPVPSGIEHVVMSALSKLRGDRPPSAPEFFRRMAAAMPAPIGTRSRILQPTSAIPMAQASASMADARPGASQVAFRTEPSMLRDGAGTLDEGPVEASTEPHTEPGGAPLLPYGSSGGESAASTGTEPGAPRLVGRVMSGALPGAAVANVATRIPAPPNVAAIPGVPRSKTRHRAVWAIVLYVGCAVGAVVGGAIWLRTRWTADDAPPKPTASLVADAVELAAESHQHSTDVGADPLPRTPAVANRPPSVNNKPTAPPSEPSPPSPSTSSAPNAVPSVQQSPAPASPLPFPFPIAIPSIFAPTGLPPAQMPPTPPAAPPTVQTPPTPTPAVSGMQHCANASALASSNLDAAVGQYQLCESAVGSTAANPTRLQLAAAGAAQARALGDQGRCDEARRVAQTLARIGAERPALNSIARSAACRSP